MHLGQPREGCLQTGLDAYWSFICKLQAHMKETNWEAGMWLRCNPQAEFFMTTFCLEQLDLHLETIPEVFNPWPVAFAGARNPKIVKNKLY